jgi:hypothetical protein
LFRRIASPQAARNDGRERFLPPRCFIPYNDGEERGHLACCKKMVTFSVIVSEAGNPFKWSNPSFFFYHSQVSGNPHNNSVIAS